MHDAGTPGSAANLDANATIDERPLSPVKRALQEIRTLKEKLSRFEGEAAERNVPIAIVGMGMSFPGDIYDAESFWDLLKSGKDAITEIPADRWDLRQYFDANAQAHGAMYAVRGGFLRRVDAFDAEFFGIAPREAATLDPQQRLLHEVAWHAIEDAAINPDLLVNSRTGIFVGLSNFDYVRATFNDDLSIDAYSGSGSSPSMAAGRLSYTLGTRGPAITLDTSCSSSLTAVHLAVQSLRLRECDAAISGGVNLILAPQMHIAFSRAQMLAADGRCKTFDASADGYVRSEGCGVIVLKRLHDAVRDGDRVIAVIRGSAINHDGRSGGLTAPSSQAQAALLREAYSKAGVSIDEVGMIEAHGTGTSLGDPIEMEALTELFKGRSKVAGAVAVGSIKTNIGHTESASGMAGLIKAVLSLEHEAIPAQLHFDRPSPFISWSDHPFYVPKKMSPWKLAKEQSKRVAGVSSFGFSGSNAHVVLEQYVPNESSLPIAPSEEIDLHEASLAVVSARDRGSIVEVCAALKKGLDDHPSWMLRDVCGTLGEGRRHQAVRRAWVVDSLRNLRDQVNTATEFEFAQSASEPTPSLPGTLGFLFTGQGSERSGMGLELYRRSEVFRGAVHRLEFALGGELEVSIASIWANEHDELKLAKFVQPAVFAYGFALSELWRSWGVEPAAVLGHSLGEYVAATVAGVMTPEGAVRLVAARGRLTDKLGAPGSMVAVGAPEADVRRLIAESVLGSEISVAAINGPLSIVVSGRTAPMMNFEELLSARKMRSKRLGTTHGFHSSALDGMLEAFEVEARKVDYRIPERRWISNVTGELVGRDHAVDAVYWRRHLRETVEFSRSIKEAVTVGVETFVEVGAESQLLALAESNGISRKRLVTSINRPAETAVGSGVQAGQTRRDEDSAMKGEWNALLSAGGRLYEIGFDLDFKAIGNGRRFKKLPLPGYPFQRTRHWFERERNSDEYARSMAEAAALQASMVPIGLDVDGIAGRRQALDAWVSATMVSTLEYLGCWSVAEPFEVESIVAKCGVMPNYERLMGRWLRRLADEGLLTASLEGGVASFAVVADAALLKPLDAWERVEGALDGDRPLRDYLTHCASLLVRVLRGELDALETLFPGGSAKLATGLYEESPGSVYANWTAAAAIAARVRAGSKTAMGFPRRTRILEIGAGTGATTAAVLRQIEPKQLIYTFSDVSEVFLARARERFKSHVNSLAVEFAIVDLDRDSSTAAHRGRYDVVLIANALHSSKDVSESLRRVRPLIQPGGSLVLVETTRSEAWHDVSTGLIEGWRHFDDDRGESTPASSNSGSPLLNTAAWKVALERADFVNIFMVPDESHTMKDLGLHVLLAHVPSRSTERSNGASIVEQIGQSATSRGIEEDKFSLSTMIASSSPESRFEMVLEAVRKEVAGVLGRTELPGVRDRLMALGLDSLMALELRNRVQQVFSIADLPATLIFDYPTSAAIAQFVMKLMGYEGVGDRPRWGSSSQTDAGRNAVHDSVHSDDQLDAMSREEIVELLRVQLRD